MRNILTLFLLLSFFLNAESKHLWIRHTEPKGVGFRDGYTTLEAFLLKGEEFGGFHPYADLRLHIFMLAGIMMQLTLKTKESGWQ